MTLHQSQTLEPIQNKSKTLNPQAQWNSNWLSTATPVTPLSFHFTSKAVFCSFSWPEITAELSSTLLRNTPARTKWQTHILQLRKNSNSRVTSTHKTFLLYLTLPVCASPLPGHQRNPFQQSLHLALSQASRDPYWRNKNTNKCKQPKLALHFWPVRNSLPFIPHRFRL